MTKVYVTQDLHKFDYTTAEAFGELVFVFPQGTPTSVANPQYLVSIAQQAFRNAEAGDYFVMSSPNPLIFAIAFAEYAMVLNGDLKILRFDKGQMEYNAVALNLGYDD